MHNSPTDESTSVWDFLHSVCTGHEVGHLQNRPQECTVSMILVTSAGAGLSRSVFRDLGRDSDTRLQTIRSNP